MKNKYLLTEESKKIVKEWKEILDLEMFEPIKDTRKKVLTALMLENYEKSKLDEKTVTGDIAKYDPILISLIRRITPDLIANDIVGVQPMKQPTGLIFAIRSHYTGTTDNPYSASTSRLVWLAQDSGGATDLTTVVSEGATLTHTASTDTFTIQALGTVTQKYGVVLVTGTDFTNLTAGTDAYTIGGHTVSVSRIESNEALFQAILTKYAGPYSATTVEQMSTNIREMGFTIEKQTVSAVSRILKAKYTKELYEDFRSVHGGDAEQELINILSNEMIAEINRNIVDTVNHYAELGGTYTFSTASADGRWSMEKFVNLYTVINKVANDIALSTRRGRGNFMIASPDVITALETAGKFNAVKPEFTLAQETPFAFAGYLTNGMKVYRDVFAFENYATIGYKGATPYDAGIFYCPYVPLQLMRATGEEDFQPRLGFRERSAIGTNPFGAENYYRKISVNFGTLLTQGG